MCKRKGENLLQRYFPCKCVCDFKLNFDTLPYIFFGSFTIYIYMNIFVWVLSILNINIRQHAAISIPAPMLKSHKSFYLECELWSLPVLTNYKSINYKSNKNNNYNNNYNKTRTITIQIYQHHTNIVNSYCFKLLGKQIFKFNLIFSFSNLTRNDITNTFTHNNQYSEISS